VVYLAQVNAATLRFPVGDPRLAGFVAAVERIHRLADVAPGFVWRDPGAHQDLHRPDDDSPPVTVVNLSVWRTYGDLHLFTYRSLHGELVRRRAEWFLPGAGPTTALWWIREDERPSATAALARLAHLRCHGPTPRAFTVRRRFGADGRPELRRRPTR
jgi:uncharacterized protein DUF3291